MAEKFTESQDFKAWRKAALLLFGWWVVLGTAANIPGRIHTSIQNPPVIKVGTPA